MHPPGSTRSAIRSDHALVAPDAHVRSPLLGWEASIATVLISPRMGAQFSQFFVEMGPSARAGAPEGGVQRFVWVIGGSASLQIEGSDHLLTPGTFALIPAGSTHGSCARPIPPDFPMLR